MARAIWSGTISFGLLNVPVKMFSAVSRKTIRFNELRESDSSRVRHKRVAESDGKEVAYDEIVKGYEISPDHYVTFSRDELDELTPEKTRAIEIQDFVDIEQIDPIYFESPYYLGPAAGAEKAYSLLVKSMDNAGKAAIARFVLRNKEHLAAIRPMGNVLTLTTMRFADEVVAPEELDDVLPDSSPRVEKREREMAEKLIDSLAGNFDPEKYHDEYREQLLSMIERKGEGKEIAVSETEEAEPTKAPDLMAALEESLAAVQGSDLGGDGGSKSKPKSKPRSKSSSRKSSGSKSKSKSRAKSKSGS